MSSKPVTLGTVLDECMKLARRRWVGEYAGGKSSEVALLEDLQEMCLTVKVGRTGQVHCYVECNARKDWQNDCYIFRLFRLAPGRYSRVPQDVTSS